MPLVFAYVARVSLYWALPYIYQVADTITSVLTMQQRKEDHGCEQQLEQEEIDADAHERTRSSKKPAKRSTRKRLTTIDTSKARSVIDVLQLCIKELGWQEV